MQSLLYNVQVIHIFQFHNIFTFAFFRFPFSNPDLVRQWITRINRVGWVPKKYSRICSDHFLTSDFVQSGYLTIRKLKRNAVPSIFSLQSNVSKSLKISRLAQCYNHSVGSTL